ncbi:MAG: DUF2723 domain-containing protein [Rikenellaceae bacterium]
MNYFKKTTLIFGWLAFVISTTVYALTMELSASLWDCGEFIATSYKMQVGHPPGAPLFMLLNRIFSIFAFDTSMVAAMVNMASAVASGLTIAFLFWTIAHLSRRLLKEEENTITTSRTWAIIGASLVGSLAYAFTDTFWFSAVEGEVYAQSSLFTAMVFWAILKWENVSEEPHSNRWLVFVAYLMGLSIGVHLLNLLAIPAIVFVYYYKHYPVRSKIGWWKAFALSVMILATVLFIIIPKTVEYGAAMDRLFVNTLSLPVNSGLATFYIALLCGVLYGSWRAFKKGRVILNTALLCLAMIVFGYGSYATVVIRAAANTPMNSNQPDDPYSLLSLLNRDQYGRTPLLYGETYASPGIDYKYSTVYKYNDETKRYEQREVKSGIKYADGSLMLFPRMYDSQQSDNYKGWANITGRKYNFKEANQVITLPTFGENLQYFFNYQLNFMYWRYFLWNFVGRQNDLQSQGEITKGGWLSGISAIDALYTGPQYNLPDDLENNPSRNKYYFLPFILGLIGLYYQLSRDRNNFTAVMWLFFMTGIAIILYLNQPPMQPRERDYAFAGSFYAFSIWIGIGALFFYELFERSKKMSPKVAAIASTVVCFSVPTILIAENWDDHDRSGRYVARDLGRNYLEAILPNSIVIPFGDNDTFPLWYNQEVEEVRQDVRVMNISYLESSWYARQMRYKTYESESIEFTMPESFYNNDENQFVDVVEITKQPMTIKQVLDFMNSDSKVKQAVKAQTGSDVFIPTRTIKFPVNKENAVKSGIITAAEAAMALDTITVTISKDDISRAKFAILDALGTADWNRAFSFTQPFTIQELGLHNYLQLEGYTYRIVPFMTRVTDEMEIGRINSAELYDNLMNKYKFGNVKDEGVTVDYFSHYTFNATQSRSIYARLANQLMSEGDTISAVKALDRIAEELPHSKVRYSYNSYPLIRAYFEAGEIEKGDELLNGFTENVLQHLNYYSLFTDRQARSLGDVLRDNVHHAQELYLISAKYNRPDPLSKLTPYMQALTAETSSRNN